MKLTSLLPPAKCLLVDDLKENLIALEALLENEVMQIFKASSGFEALELMMNHEFALALIDVQMPEMDGFELAELMRGTTRTRTVPIIFVTAGVRERDRVFQGYEAGAVDFIFKPLEPAVVKSKVRVFIELDRQRRLLGQQEALYRTTFENAPVGIAHVGLDSRWVMLNPRYCEILGYEEKELREMSYADLTHSSDIDKEGPFSKDLLAGRCSSYSLEKRYVKKSGKMIWVDLHVALIRDDYGQPAHFVTSVQDITSQKEAEEALESAKIAAENANQTKTDFLANMSHEIRTPMTAILGFSDVLLSEELTTDERTQFLSRIRVNGDALLHLIDDILDLSKFEGGQVPLEMVEFSPAQLAQEVINLLRDLAGKRDLEVKFMPAGKIPKTVTSDSFRVRQVLTNLLSNAIKFTDHGKIEIRMACARSTSEDVVDRIEFEIEDTGIGISEGQRAKLFLPFSQADASITRRFGGTGLGLALSRRLAEALGGELKLKSSDPGVGSCFYFDFAAGDLSTTEFVAASEIFTDASLGLEPLEKGRLENRQLLLAEDSPDNEALMQIYLEREGAKVDFARDGFEAIEKALKRDYDVILMDIQMPGLDGLEVTRRLRKAGCGSPIIALTAHALREEEEKSLNAGCNAHVTKPIKRDELIDAIREVLT